jgi:hypothetical protein
VSCYSIPNCPSFVDYIPDANKVDVAQTAINFVNDSYRSTLCLQYTPQQIAIGMIYLTFVVLSVKPVSRSPYVELSWISLFEKEIDHITLRSKSRRILFLFHSIITCVICRYLLRNAGYVRVNYG